MSHTHTPHTHTLDSGGEAETAPTQGSGGQGKEEGGQELPTFTSCQPTQACSEVAARQRETAHEASQGEAGEAHQTERSGGEGASLVISCLLAELCLLCKAWFTIQYNECYSYCCMQGQGKTGLCT